MLSQYSTPGLRALATRALGISAKQTGPAPAGALAAAFNSGSDTADDHPGSGATNDVVSSPTSDVATAAAGGGEAHPSTPAFAARPFEPPCELADAGASAASPSKSRGRDRDDSSCATCGTETETPCSSAPGWSTVLIGSIKAIPRSESIDEMYEAPMIFNQHTLSWEGGEVDMSGFDEDEGESVGRESRLGSATPPAAHRKPTVPPSCGGLVAASAAGGRCASQSSQYRLSRKDRAFFAQCEREHVHAMELFMSPRCFAKLRRHDGEQAWGGGGHGASPCSEVES